MKLAMGATRGAEWTRAELSGWITESVASAQREIENRFISVPRRNGFFTGREEVLARLHAELTSGGRAAITQAISGLGGIGKTAMAIEYAHRHKDDYACVLWTNAASEGALTAGFASFAEGLGLAVGQEQAETVKAVKRWLATNRGWLLILDNADAPEVVTDFLPNPLTGAALLTSRATNFDALTIAQAVELGVMTRDEAQEFLRKRTGRNLLDAEGAAARELAEELGYLPLALEQAAAYVKAKRVSFAKYAELYRDQRLEILKKSRPPSRRWSRDARFYFIFHRCGCRGVRVRTLMRHENAFNPNAMSFKDGRAWAHGLMELIPATARRFGVANPYDPAQAIAGGSLRRGAPPEEEVSAAGETKTAEGEEPTAKAARPPP